MLAEAAALLAALVPLFILLYVLQCAWFIRTQSFTVDESDHIIAGLEAWRFGELSDGMSIRRWRDFGSHFRLSAPIGSTRTGLVTLPGRNRFMLDLNWTWLCNPTPSATQAGTPTKRRSHPTGAGGLALSRRSTNVCLGSHLLLVLWFTARRLFSRKRRDFHACLGDTFSELIAHYSVATTDGAGTLFTFAAVAQLIRWRHNPASSQTSLLGILLEHCCSPS